METAIEVKDASFFYNKIEGEAPIHVFEHLDLTIAQGTVCGDSWTQRLRQIHAGKAL